MTIVASLARFVGHRTPVMVTAGPAVSAPEKTTAALSSVPPASLRQKSDGLRQLILREMLIAEARRLRLSSRCKEASCRLAEAKALTTAILRGPYAR